MSASTEKKIRAQARAEGTDKKAIAAAEEAAKAKKVKTWTIVTIIAVLVFVVGVLSLNSPAVYRGTTAITVGDDSFSPAEVNYIYANEYYTLINNYGSYTSLIGLDTSYGLAGLKDQMSYFGEEGQTWRDYFLDRTVDNLKQSYVLNKLFNDNGLELSEEEIADIDAQIDAMGEMASYYGYSSGDKFASSYYGKGVNTSVMKNMMTYAAKAEAAFNEHAEAVEISNDEIAERYPSVAIRHILVKAVADEDGTISEDALAEAKAKAEDIYEQWKNGDATEESFAALATEFSEDEGSNSEGGLYANVIQGQTVEEFNAFCFDENRKSGDTDIVYGTNGSYEGYHIMYFVGEGDPSTNETGRTYILNEKMGAWLDDITKDVNVAESFWLRLVGKA